MTRIVLAEDSNVIQRMLKTILAKDKSLEIVGQAKDGNEAVQMTKDNSPDIVIMDYRMPNLSGAEAIKQIMHDKPTPILVLTSAEPVEKVQQEVIDLGAVGFMSKPKSMDYSDLATRLIMNIKTLSRMKVRPRP